MTPTNNAVDVERTNEGVVSIVLSVLSIDTVTNATVSCATTATLAAVASVTVSVPAAQTSVTVPVTLDALTGYQCTATTANAGGSSVATMSTFVTKKGPAPVVASRSIASGPAVCDPTSPANYYQIVGWSTSVVVQAFDSDGLLVSGRNAGTLSAQLVSLTASDPTDPSFSFYGVSPASDTSSAPTITNFLNGTFEVAFQVPLRRGTYELRLSLDTGDAAASGAISNSPIRFFALPSTQTKVSFEGVPATVRAFKGFPISFSGIYRDSNDNFMGRIPAGVATSTCPAAFAYRSSAGTAADAPVAASISASPATPVDVVTTKGTYGTGGTWVDKFVLTGKTSVDGSATVTVTGTVGASSSTVTTISLTAGNIAISKSGVVSDVCKTYTAGKPFTLRIELKDDAGAKVDGFSTVTVTPTYLGPTSSAAAPGEIVFTLPDSFVALINPNSFPSAATATVSAGTDGSYTASVTAFKAGYYRLSVSINGQPAGVGASLAVFVAPGEAATAPDAAFPTYNASRLEWLASPNALAGQNTTAYLAVRDAFGNLVEPSAYESIASVTNLQLGLSTTSTVTGCPSSSSSIPLPWAASAVTLAAPANVVKVLPVVAPTGLSTTWGVAEQPSTLAGVYQITFSVCPAGLQQIQASYGGKAFGNSFPLTVNPNILAGIQGASTLTESTAGPLAAEAVNWIRVTGVDACGNVVNFDQAPNNAYEFAFSGGFAKLPFFADFTTAAGATPLCSYVRYQGVIGCFRELKISRVVGTTGVVTISYKLFATGDGKLNLFVNTRQTTFIEGSRIASTDEPVAKVSVSRIPKDPIEIVSARFSDAGNTVLFELSDNSDMLQSYMGTSGALLDSARNVRASAIFENAETLFGPASYCSFVSPRVMEVTIAGVTEQNIGSLAGPSTNVRIASAGAPIYNAIGNSARIPSSAPAKPILAPNNPPTPVVQLTGDTSVGKCDPAEYIAKVESGGCGRPLGLTWTVTKDGTAMTPGASSYQESGTALRILASNAGTYTVAVTGKNFLQEASTQQTITLVKTETAIPRVVIAEGARLESAKTTDTTLTARATFSSCPTGSSSSEPAMEFKWFVGGEQTAVTSSSFTIGPTGVSLAPRDAPYEIKVEGTVKGTDLKNSFTTMLTVKAARLVADVKAFAESGGVLQQTSTIGIDTNIELNATASFDPDNFDPKNPNPAFDTMLSCKWTIAASSPANGLAKDANGFIAAGSGVSIPSDKNGCVLKIAAETLKPDKTSPRMPFVFTVQVTRSDTLNRAAATASIPVVVSEFAPPAVSIVIDGSRTVNAFRELKLTGAIEAPRDIDADDFKRNGETKYKLQYLWTVQSASTLDLQDKNITESSTGPSLVLKRNVLRPGQTYTFALSVTLEKDGKIRTASAETTLEVNRPPASGSCKLLQLVGGSLQSVTSAKALTEEYRLSCSDWVTNSPPLQYAFEVEDDTGKKSTLRGYSSDSTLPKVKAFPVRGSLKFRGYIRDATGAFTVFNDLAPVPVEDPTIGKSASQVAQLIKDNTDAATSTCIRAQDYVCAFGSILTATNSAQQQAAINARRRKALETFTSVPARRRLSAVDPALLQIQIDALRSATQAVEGAAYSRTTVSAAASQYATVLGAGFAAEYSASIIHDALALAGNLTSRYVRDCSSYTPDTDAVIENLVRGSLNVFSNDAGVNRTLASSLSLRHLLAQLGRRSLECGTCASTLSNSPSPVAAYAAPTASRKDAELLPLQLCVSRTVAYPPQTVAFAGFDSRVVLPSSFALSVLGNATTDRTLDLVALRLPAALYSASERFASDVVQISVFKAGCGASCESLPIAGLPEPVTFAGLVPASAAFDFMSERISLSRFNVSASTWTETTPGAIAVRGVDMRYASAEANVVPASATAVLHDIAHVVRSRPESRNVTSRATLGIAFVFYPGQGNTTAASIFANSSASDPAGLVAAIAARIRARAAALGSAASQVAGFDQDMQLAVETGAISPSAAGAVEGLQITFSFFGVANPAAGTSRPSSVPLRDFVYADALINGLDLSAIDPLLVGGVPRALNGQRITSPGVPGIGGFRNTAGSALSVVLSFPAQAVTLATFRTLYPVSASVFGNPRLVRSVLGALRGAVNGTSFSADLAKVIDIQMAYVGAEAGSVVLSFNAFGALLASPAANGGFEVAATATGPEAIARALVYASLTGGLTLPLADGSRLTGGTVRSIGGSFAGVAPYVAAVAAELRRAAPAVSANASRLNFTIRVENGAGSFAAWLTDNYDALDAATRDDYWALSLFNFLRQIDPSVNVNGVLFPGRAAFADGVSNGTRRHALQLTVSPSVDITGIYLGSSPILGSGSGFSRNSTFCGTAYTVSLPSGTATARPQCTQTDVKAQVPGTGGPISQGQTSSPASSGLSGGQIAGIAVGIIVGVVAVIAIAAFVFMRKNRGDAMDLPRPVQSAAYVVDANGVAEPVRAAEPAAPHTQFILV
eukprot:tig00020603_g11833.t1